MTEKQSEKIYYTERDIMKCAGCKSWVVCSYPSLIGKTFPIPCQGYEPADKDDEENEV